MLLIGCSFDPAELSPEELRALSRPIVNGATDTGHTAVGMLTTNGSGHCTGTLVGTRIVLTAAHCVVKEKKPPYSLRPKMGWSPDGGNTVIPAASVVYHSGYGQGLSGLQNDVAVLRLSQDAAVEPMLIASTPPTKGEPITLVGYGYTKDGATATFGTKRKATNTIGKVTATEIVFYGATGSVGNICNGDSGGPAFAQRGGQELLVGIHSWGEGECGVAEHDARADIHLDWIRQQAQGNLWEGKPKDSQPPQVEIAAPGAQAQVPPSFQVEVNAQDDVEVDRVELFIDGKLLDSMKETPFVFAASNLGAGPHNLRAEAVDKAGHRSSTLVTVTVVVEGQPPPAGGVPPAGPTPPQAPAPGPGPGSSTPGAQHGNDLVGACNLVHGGSTPLPLVPLLLLGLLLLRRDRR
jgi:V8-like Glu-specific endopeptidase